MSGTFPQRISNNFSAQRLERSYKFTGWDEPTMVVETWHIWITEDIKIEMELNINYMTLVNENMCPTEGQLYYEWVGEIAYVNPFNDAAFQSADFVELKNGHVQATYVFSNRRNARWVTEGEGEEQTTTILRMYPISVESQATTRQIMFYRNGLTLIPPVATIDESPSDILGDSLMYGEKEGLVGSVPQVKLRVRQVREVGVEGFTIDGFNTNFSLMVGTRNETAFLGFPIQSVIMDGFNTAKLEGRAYEIIFDFTFDRYYEHSQVPEMDTDFMPKMNNLGTEFSDVRWKRPTRETAEHNDIFFNSDSFTVDPDRQAQAEKGYYV